MSRRAGIRTRQRPRARANVETTPWRTCTGSCRSTTTKRRWPTWSIALGRHFEAGVGGDWRFDFDNPRERSQLRGIIGFRFVVARIEMKFKPSQNHPAANIAAVIAALERQSDADARATAALMHRTAATVQGDER